MGLPACFHDHAGHRHASDCRDDRRPASQGLRLGRDWHARSFCLSLAFLALAGPLWADGIRLATWNVELFRKGPGLLLRDLLRGDDPQIKAVLAVLEKAEADVLVLQGLDYDLGGEVLSRLAALADYPHFFAARPNAGWQAGLDMDGDGRLGEPEDALGYGAFSGQAGMAVLSRFPIGAVTDHSSYLWRDLPETLLPAPGSDWPSAEVHAALPLSSMAHWEVPVSLHDRMLHLWTFHAAPPVFDGPEDRNGRRNHDEIAFWQHRLEGTFGPVPEDFVLIGDFNMDPEKGDGRNHLIRDVLSDPRLQATHPTGAAGTDTVAWEDPGQMRVSYILPRAGLKVLDAGVLWPEADHPLAETTARASRHRLVWVDLDWP